MFDFNHIGTSHPPYQPSLGKKLSAGSIYKQVLNMVQTTT